MSTPSWRKEEFKGQPARGGAAGEWDSTFTRGVWSAGAGRYLALGLLALTLVGTFAMWGDEIRRDRLPTRLLALIETTYDEPAPPNPLSTEDLAFIKSVFSGYDNLRLEIPSGDIQTTVGLLDHIDKFLTAADKVSSQEKPVSLLYLSAIGLVDSAGEPCLVLPQHNVMDEKTWMKWSDLKRRIQKSKPEGSVTVVLLDSSQIDVDWSLGVVQNGFIELMKESLTRENSSELFVLSATSGIEKKASAPSLVASPFAYYATLGLRGGADGNSDGKVSLSELASYVNEEVAAWTLSHLGCAQHPILLGGPDGADMLSLVDVGELAEPAKLEPASIADSEIDAGEALWTKYNQAIQRQVAVSAEPVLLARVESDLRRLDEYLLAGAGYNNHRLADAADKRVTELIACSHYVPGLWQGSLAEVAPEKASSEETSEALSKVWQAWREKPAETQAPASYHDRVRVAWNHLAHGEESRGEKDFSDAVAFLDTQSSDRSTPDVQEVAIIRLLANHLDWTTGASQAAIQPLLLGFEEVAELARPESPELVIWIEHPLQPIDADLHRALDLILVGDRSSVDEAQQILRGVDRSIADLRKLSVTASEARYTRDEAWRVALTVGEWLQCLCIQDIRLRPSFEKVANNLLEANLTLSKTLREGPSAIEGDVRRLTEKLSTESQAVARVLVSLKTLHENMSDRAFRQEHGSLVETRPLRMALLRFPVVVDTNWLSLRRSLLVGDESGEVAKDSTESIDDHIDWLASQRHPLAIAFGMSLSSSMAGAGVAEQLREFAKIGGGVRHALAGLGGDLDTKLLEVRKQLGSNESLIAARLPLAESADQLRLRVGVSRGRLASKDVARHAAASLRAFDTHMWSLWHASRAIASFIRTDALPALPWFQVVAEKRLAEAQRLFQSATHQPMRVREEQLASKVEGFAKATPIDASKSSVTIEGGEKADCQLVFESISAAAPSVAAASLGKPDSSPIKLTGEASRRAVKISAEQSGRKGGSLHSSLPIAEVQNVDVLTASLLLRGHVWSSTLPISRSVDVIYKKPPPEASSIRVRADTDERADVVFVFDCSATMAERKGNPLRSRLDQARDAFGGSLRSLQLQEGANRAALVLYGHRFGYVEEVGKVRVSPRLVNVQAQHPGDDVELAVRLSRLDTFCDDAKQRLQEATPYGFTPLYLAINTALDHLKSLNVDSRGHIVVISDGNNDQGSLDEYGVADPRGGATPVKLANRFSGLDLKERIERNGDPERVRINVLLFGEEADSDLREITKLTGGKIAEARDAEFGADWLEDELRKALGIEDFIVENADEGLVVGQQRLSGEVQLSPGPGKYTVSLERSVDETATIEVEGGEAVELDLKRGLRRFVNRPYPTDGAKGKIGRLIVGADMPETRAPSGYNFRFSIQRQDGSYCERPEVVWVKVMPADRGPSGQRDDAATYYFFERDFVPDKPVPVLQTPVGQWPLRSAQVEIIVLESRPSSPAPLKLPGFTTSPVPLVDVVEGVRLTAEHLQRTGEGGAYRIRQTHRDDGEAYPLHVQITPAPDRVVHSFSAETKSATHTFEFFRKPSVDPVLHVYTKHQLEEAAGGKVDLEVALPAR